MCSRDKIYFKIQQILPYAFCMWSYEYVMWIMKVDISKMQTHLSHLLNCTEQYDLLELEES